MVRLLLDRGVNVSTASPFAVPAQNKNVIELLLNRGANIDTVDGTNASIGYEKSTTPVVGLETAVRSGDEAMTLLLLDRGADVNKADRFGITVLETAVRVGNESMVRFLLDRGADVNQARHFRGTVLETAVTNGN